MRILLTGGHGFLGRYVHRRLLATDHEVIAPRHADADLTQRIVVEGLMDEIRPHAVIHLAANVGGIGANVKAPGLLYFGNARMGLEVVEQSRKHGAYLIVAGTVCEYPADVPVPIREGDLWNGEPASETAAYGHAKRGVLAQQIAYQRQFGWSSCHLILAGLYGPHDHFAPVEMAHVIPAMIHRFSDATRSGGDVELWGTGEATRDFVYVDDAARAICAALEVHPPPDPINIGSGVETRIGDLAEEIALFYPGEIEVRWNEAQPVGQQRRCLDISRAKWMLGWTPDWNLRDGLEQTVRWYEGRRDRLERGS